MKKLFDRIFIINILIYIFFMTSCSGSSHDIDPLPASFNPDKYIDMLLDKKVGVVANHASYIGNRHLVDSLIALGVNIVKIYSPEHGFKGHEDAGASLNDTVYGTMQIPVISLYGIKKKPLPQDLEDVDLVVFDLQDVGVRFYTYLSTLHYIMEACAENHKPLVVLDRPNPNGHYIDGPVLKNEFRSFVGMHPVPLVYGMTIGEYALMINGEGWLKNAVTCNLTVIPCIHYLHSSLYELPIPPSPNLREMKAIYLYPSLALFEGTIVSVGRGTDFPFLVAGHPDYPGKDFSFVPVSMPGVSTNPVFLNTKCYGIDLRQENMDPIRSGNTINLKYLLNFYSILKKGNAFFTDYFELLTGTSLLREQIKQGKTEDEIRNSWKEDLEEFKKIRAKYLLYPD